MFEITASRLSLLEKCPGSYSIKGSTSSTNEDAERGTEIHEFLKLCLIMGRERALAEMKDEYIDDCEAIDTSELFAGKYTFSLPEVALAYDWRNDAARPLHYGQAARDYTAATSDEICGTADRIDEIDGELFIRDYKTGHAFLGSPKQSLQLLFYAVAATLAYEKENVTVSFVFLNGAKATYVSEKLTTEDLRNAVERIRGIISKAQSLENIANPSFIEGAHCKYCPSFNLCPAKATLATRLAKESLGKENPALFQFPLTKDNFPEILIRLEASEQLLERIRKVCVAFASTEPIALPDGQLFGEVTTKRESINPDAGYEYIKKIYGGDVARECTHFSITKTALASALKKIVLPRTQNTGIGQLEKEALDHLRRIGAIETKTTKSVKRYTPNKHYGITKI